MLGPDIVVDYDGVVDASHAVSVDDFDDTDSWSVDGAAITSHQWAAPGSSTLADDTTESPHIEYQATGTFWVSDTIGTGAASFTGYRRVIIFDNTHRPVTNFTLQSCSGDFERGGWEFRVELSDPTELTSVRYRAPVLLFSKDWYGDHQGSLGPLAGRENIIATGWISDEDLIIDPDGGKVVFTVQGPQYWLDQMENYPFGIEDTTSAPASWLDFENLTVDKAAWLLLHWCSTATSVMDVYLSGDTKRAERLEASYASVWQQLLTVCDAPIFAKPCCNRYGQLYIQVLGYYERDTYPNVLDILEIDRSEVEIESHSPQTSQIDLSGISWSGSVWIAFRAFAPGHSPAHHGRTHIVEYMLLADQAGANTLAALMYARDNNPYPFIHFVLGSNNRFVDICPTQTVGLELAAEDTPRGIALLAADAFLFYPRSLEMIHDPETNSFSVDVTVETDFANVGPSVTGDTPANGEPEDPPTPWPEYPPYPDIPPYPAATQFCRTYTMSTMSPGVGGKLGPQLADNQTLVHISIFVPDGTSVSVNLEYRTDPASPGVDVMSSELTGNAGMQSTAMAFAHAELPKYS